MIPKFETVKEFHSKCFCGGNRQELFAYFNDETKTYSEQYIECTLCGKRDYKYNTSTLIEL